MGDDSSGKSDLLVVESACDLTPDKFVTKVKQTGGSKQLVDFPDYIQEEKYLEAMRSSAETIKESLAAMPKVRYWKSSLRAVNSFAAAGKRRRRRKKRKKLRFDLGSMLSSYLSLPAQQAKIKITARASQAK